LHQIRRSQKFDQIHIPNEKVEVAQYHL